MNLILNHHPDGTMTALIDWALFGVYIPASFAYDGASIPRFAWSILGLHPKSYQVLRASRLHDYLISIGYNGHRRDLLFYRQLRVDGVSKRKAKLMYFTVRKWRQAKG